MKIEKIVNSYTPAYAMRAMPTTTMKTNPLPQSVFAVGDRPLDFRAISRYFEQLGVLVAGMR